MTDKYKMDGTMGDCTPSLREILRAVVFGPPKKDELYKGKLRHEHVCSNSETYKS